VTLSPELRRRVWTEIETIERSIQIVKEALAKLAREGGDDDGPDVQDDR
jgi:hypothetical protein